jgi:HEAT repeat protein
LLLAAMALASVEAERQLRDPDPKLRERAAKTLAEEGNPAYVPALGAAVQDKEEKVRMAVVRALIQLGTQASLAPLAVAVKDSIPEIRFLAIDGIVNFYLPGYVESGLSGLVKSVTQRVEGFFSNVDNVVADADVKPDDAVVRTLRQAMTGHPDMSTRIRAARALGILRARQAVPDMVDVAFGSNVELTAEVLLAFQKIKDRSVGPRITFLLGYPQKTIQASAATTLGLLQTESAVPELRRLLDGTDDKNVRRAAFEALAFMPQKETASIFLQHLDDKEEEMRASAALGLGRLKDPAHGGILEEARQKERDAGARLALDFALVAQGKMNYIDELVSSLNSRTRRSEAQPYLVELARDLKVREVLYPRLYSTDPEIRKGLCAVFGASGDSTSLSYLEISLKDRDAEVVQEASRAIRALRARGF